MSKWEVVGKQMVVNLENAKEQYKVLGYPHRTVLKMRCPLCRKITLCDESILYEFCPHCGEKLDTRFLTSKRSALSKSLREMEEEMQNGELSE